MVILKLQSSRHWLYVLMMSTSLGSVVGVPAMAVPPTVTHELSQAGLVSGVQCLAPPPETMLAAQTCAGFPPVGSWATDILGTKNPPPVWGRASEGRAIAPQAAPDVAAPLPPGLVAIAPPLLASAPAVIQTRYPALLRLLERYESAVITAESQRQAPNQTFLQTIEQMGKAPRRPMFPDRLQTVRDSWQQLNQAIASQEFEQAASHLTTLERQIWADYPMNAPIQHPETRAIWLDRGTIVRARSERDLAQVFNRLADAGINTVFFETLNASYPIYPSVVAPEQNPLTQGWDPLAAAVKLAHAQGMELHAWIWIFAAANQRHNTLLGQPDNYPGPVLTQHPDWAITDRQGHLFHPHNQKAFLDPANPEVRHYLLQIVDEIATQYAVDGVHLDYIRYPFQDPSAGLTIGYGIASRRQFYQQVGVDPLQLTPRDRQWEDWNRFRIQQVNSFVQEISALLRRKHPDTLLSAAVFPFPTRERLTKIQQNWEAWVQNDDIDFLVPMTYAADTEEFRDLTQLVVQPPAQGTTLFLPGIRLLQLPTVAAFDQMQYLRDHATGGYALFAAENLSLNLQSTLRQHQGRRTPQATEPIAHRHPFAAAHARYQALQREWQYLIVQQELTVDERTLRTWANQSTALESQLAALSTRPSAASFRQVRTQLSQFRRQLTQWVAPSAARSPYRTQVWQNRLASIDQLLRYGQTRGLH